MSEALITAQEAEEVIKIRTGPFGALRTPLLIGLVVAIIIVVSLLVMLLLSLRGSRTGLEAALPFLDKQAVQTLQDPTR
ncbi:MAG: hypothetical protein HZB70_03870 [Candidatus Berkelbacteria bacterium]|nr:MAG: hypothetical protein HZB70_03870 [Candidatus Berkelbacteria bacterium]QQG51563.1 MAG: hypothetical protein HY845_03320 [Candidatus Berkelbacteria bacterium]